MCDLAKDEAEQFDIIASNSHSEGLSVFQGQVQNTEISDSVGLGIRVIKDGRPGYAHTERLTKEALQQTRMQFATRSGPRKPISSCRSR